MKDVSVLKSRLQVGFKGLINNSDESVLDMAYSKKACNFAFENGVLTGGIGIDKAAGYFPAPSVSRHEYPPLPEGKTFRDVFYYRRLTEEGVHDDRIVAHLMDGRFMYTSVFKNDTWHSIDALIMTGEVCAVNYNYRGDDVLLLSSEKDYLFIVNDALPLVCTNAPKFTSLTVHNERVYGSVNGSQNQVWFSDDFNPVNWSVSTDEAGYINFSDDCGEVIKVVSFLNYLYIFREYGIFRLTAYGDQNEFLLKKVFTDTGRIVKNSIELCGDKIIFYAEDGLFAFDGYQVTRIAKEIPPIIRKHLMSCAYLDGYYFLACDAWVDDTYNNAVIRYNLKDNSISILYGYSVKKIRAVRAHNGAQALCVFNSNGTLGMMSDSGKVLGTATQKTYESPFNDLSSSSIKTVRSVSICTSDDIVLRVKTDAKSYDFEVKGGDEMRVINVEKSGRKIGFELYCDKAQIRISPLIVALDIMQI